MTTLMHTSRAGTNAPDDDAVVHEALAAILEGNAMALLRLVVDTPLSLATAARLSVQAHRSDLRRGVDGLPVHKGGCLAAMFYGTARRQMLCAAEEEGDDDDDAHQCGSIGQMDKAVLVLGIAAAKADDPSLLDCLMELEPRATLSTRPNGPGTLCEMPLFFTAKRAPRCLARWQSVHARGRGARIDRIYYAFEHAKARLQSEAARQLARLSGDNATGTDAAARLSEADKAHVLAAGGRIEPLPLMRELLRVLVQGGRVEVLPTCQGTSSFGLALLGRSELVVECDEYDNGAHRRLRRMAQRMAEAVDYERAARALPVEGRASTSQTLLSELMSPLTHLRPAGVPLALLLRGED